jgi:hypothetical protein
VIIIDENKVNDNAQWAAEISRISEVSGLGGKIFVHSIRRDKNFIPVTITRVMIKVRVKNIINFAKFLTILV